MTWWRSVDTRPKLFGRGLTENPRQSRRKGPMHLWDHVAPPPVQNSVVVWKDGTVTEGTDFGSDVFGSPNVHYVVQGGHDYRCPDLDAFTLQALMSAGYSCCDDRLDLYVETDAYTADYPRAEDCT